MTMEEWARGLAVEAYVQGFRDGQEHGHSETIERGRRGARLMSDKQIRGNEYPSAPIAGNEMDGAEGIEDWVPVENRTESEPSGAEHGSSPATET